MLATFSLATALTDVGTVVSSCIGIIEDNVILAVMFAGAILGVGFKALRGAKRAAK